MDLLINGAYRAMMLADMLLATRAPRNFVDAHTLVRPAFTVF